VPSARWSFRRPRRGILSSGGESGLYTSFADIPTYLSSCPLAAPGNTRVEVASFIDGLCSLSAIEVTWAQYASRRRCCSNAKIMRIDAAHALVPSSSDTEQREPHYGIGHALLSEQATQSRGASRMLCVPALSSPCWILSGRDGKPDRCLLYLTARQRKEPLTPRSDGCQYVFPPLLAIASSLFASLVAASLRGGTPLMVRPVLEPAMPARRTLFSTSPGRAKLCSIATTCAAAPVAPTGNWPFTTGGLACFTLAF
jgi:hypothetical protein